MAEDHISMSNDGIELRPHHTKRNVTTRVSNIRGAGALRRNNEIDVSGLGLTNDEVVLAGFGKRQQLKRRFKYVSAIGLTYGLMLSWTAITTSLQLGLANGGPAGLIYGFIGAFAGAMLQALVMAELSSMIPLAGGAFNWVAVLAPPKHRRFMSYIAGWLTVITYQLFVLGIAYTCAVTMQGLAILTIPSYTPQLWHATLISYAVALFGFFVNTYLGRILPQIESFLLIFTVMVYFATLIPLIYLSPRRSPSEVFGTFLNLNGWDNNGISFLVGWITSVGAYIGVDGADHIAEEIEDSAKVIPFAMWFSTLFNGVLAFGMLLVLLFVTQDYEAAATTDTGFAFMEIFETSLNSADGAKALIVLAIVVNVLSISSCIATASRALWAFSRENAVPFSKHIVKIDTKTRLPYNAIVVTIGIEMLIALISVGSSTAYAAFYSAQLAVYYSTFLIAASVMLHKRLTTPASEIPWGPFRLGVWGTPITIVAILYTIVTLFFSFFPTTIPVTPTNMNYSSLIYGAAVMVMLGFWVLHGRHVYIGPIWELGDEYTRKN